MPPASNPTTAHATKTRPFKERIEQPRLRNRGKASIISRLPSGEFWMCDDDHMTDFN
jgi:hypothetical protein